MGRSCALVRCISTRTRDSYTRLQLLATAGVKLILVDMNEAGLQTVAKATGLPADSLLIKSMSISDGAAVDSLYEEIEAKFGRLDYAV